VTLHCPDPRFYEYGTDMGDYRSVSILHGTSEVISVGGNTDALPWFTLEGPFDDYGLITLTSATPDLTDKVLLDLGDGNNVDIVTRTRYAVKNQTLRPDIIDRENTDWFTLPPGSNTISFTTGGGTDGGTICIVRWQDARF
jgi:phage-related protein